MPLLEVFNNRFRVLYDEYNLLDTAYNSLPTFREPFILRGIQAPGKYEGERWGPVGTVNIVRGGIITQAERGTADLTRIGKFLATPKGVLWVAKQNVLINTVKTSQPSNIVGTINRKTRIWTPVGLLGQVGASGLGAHFKFDQNVQLYWPKEQTRREWELSITNPETSTRFIYNKLTGNATERINGKNPFYYDSDSETSAPARDSGIITFATTQYNQIPNPQEDGSVGNGEFYDFRRLREGDTTKVPSFEMNYSAAGAGKSDEITKFDFTEKTTRSEIYSDHKDLIEFYFSDGRADDGDVGNLLVFRAYITTFNDSIAPDWLEIPMLGRVDPTRIQTGWLRNVDLDFRVVANSKEELRPMWRKINYLASYTAPQYYGASRYQGSIMRLTVGNIFQRTPCIINSYNLSFDNEYPWEVGNDPDNADLLQVPKYVDMSLSLTMIMDYRPEFKGRMYSLSKYGTSNNSPGNKQWLPDSVQANTSPIREDNP